MSASIDLQLICLPALVCSCCVRAMAPFPFAFTERETTQPWRVIARQGLRSKLVCRGGMVFQTHILQASDKGMVWDGHLGLQPLSSIAASASDCTSRETPEKAELCRVSRQGGFHSVCKVGRQRSSAGTQLAFTSRDITAENGGPKLRTFDQIPVLTRFPCLLARVMPEWCWTAAVIRSIAALLLAS